MNKTWQELKDEVAQAEARLRQFEVDCEHNDGSHYNKEDDRWYCDRCHAELTAPISNWTMPKYKK